MKALLLLSFVGAALASFIQQPLLTPSEFEGEFRVFRSERSLDHAVRIKKQNATLCNTPVDQYTGWLDVGAHHLFFWYFAAQTADAAAMADDALPLAL